MSEVETAIKSYKDLVVWQEAVALAALTYGITRLLPKSETYGMASQMQRSAVSIAANIAEGHGREQTGSFIQSLRIAQRSLKELETHLIVAEKVALVTSQQCQPLNEKCDAVGRMLRSLIRSLQNWTMRSTKRP